MRIKTPDSALKVSVAVLAQLIRYLASLAIDTAKVFHSLGVDASIIDSPDAQIPIETYISFEDEAARISGDPCFGLHMGEFVEPGNYSILGYIMMNSRTLAEAFARSARYYRIIGNLLTPSVRLGFKKVTTILSAPKNAPRFSRHCFEAAFSGSVTMVRHLSGRDVSPLEVGFTAEAPASLDEYRRVFKCPVFFGRAHNSITYNLSISGIPVLQPNPSLLEYFDSYAREFLAEIERTEKTSDIVARRILSHLGGSRFSIGLIAREMCVSVRSLQLRLKAEGTDYSAVLEKTRERLARQYLDRRMPVEDIVCLLGFSEASVFRKAFKKWTGLAPGEYRERSRAEERRPAGRAASQAG